MIKELATSSIEVTDLFITHEFEKEIRDSSIKAERTTVVSAEELKKISLLKTPQDSLAVCKIPAPDSLPDVFSEPFSLYLDSIQDPGNMGTILRICDWYGIQNIFCSEDTVDVYNPKVIQASMGSFARVKVFRSSFSAIKSIAQNSGTTVYGAFMIGKNVYQHHLSPKALLVVGNEGNGISENVEEKIDEKLNIPNFSKQKNRAESLNVAVATAILCSEFKRQG